MSKFNDYSLSTVSDELKKLIIENPDLPIVVLAGEEANSGGYSWVFCTDIYFRIDEILDCDFYDHDDTVITDRDRLEEIIEDNLYPEANRELLKPNNMTDEECSSLWVYSDGRECVSCWRLTWRQRLAALFYGRVWLSVLSGHTQPPVWLDCGKTVFIKEK